MGLMQQGTRLSRPLLPKTQPTLNSLAVQVLASGCHAYLLSSPSGANDPAQCLLEGCRREPAHQAARRADEPLVERPEDEAEQQACGPRDGRRERARDPQRQRTPRR